MTTYDEINVFIDTNKLESRVGDRVFLNEITPQKDYCELIRLIKEFGLENKVHVFIPEVVWLEVAEHMRRDYLSYKQSIIDMINKERKMFGSLIDVDLSFRLDDEKVEYDKYIEQIQNEFLDNPKTRASIMPYPKEQEVMERLLDKATHTISPFSKAQGNNGKKKKYSDAGFKDALIFETFVANTKDDELGILFTNDTDFDLALKGTKKNNLCCISDYNKLKQHIFLNYGIQDEEIIVQKIKDNTYLFEQICSEMGITIPDSIVFESIMGVENVDEGVSFKLTLRLNGEAVVFDVIYDLNANELYSVNFSED